MDIRCPVHALFRIKSCSERNEMSYSERNEMSYSERNEMSLMMSDTGGAKQKIDNLCLHLA